MKERDELCLTPDQAAAAPLLFDAEKCLGCNKCLEACQVDILMPNPKVGSPPLVIYPGECWYCGCCVMECPVEGAITLRHPLMNRVRWVEKKTLLERERPVDN
jgi:Na+-translocating ferredoxin:NAD+ oxidoreductase RNF subunit RnfB